MFWPPPARRFRPAHDTICWPGWMLWPLSQPSWPSSPICPRYRPPSAVRCAYLDIIQEYERISHETHFKSFLATLPDHEREIIYVLARALRQADGAPGEVVADSRVLLQARACSSFYARSQFLLVSAQHAVARYQEVLSQASDPDRRAVWEVLLSMANERLLATGNFIKSVSFPHAALPDNSG